MADPVNQTAAPPWRSIGGDLPGWRERYGLTQVRRADGSVLDGTLEIVDTSPGPDEHPVLELRIAGEIADLFEFEE